MMLKTILFLMVVSTFCASPRTIYKNEVNGEFASLEKIALKKFPRNVPWSEVTFYFKYKINQSVKVQIAAFCNMHPIGGSRDKKGQIILNLDAGKNLAEATMVVPDHTKYALSTKVRVAENNAWKFVKGFIVEDKKVAPVSRRFAFIHPNSNVAKLNRNIPHLTPAEQEEWNGFGVRINTNSFGKNFSREDAIRLLNSYRIKARSMKNEISKSSIFQDLN